MCTNMIGVKNNFLCFYGNHFDPTVSPMSISAGYRKMRFLEPGVDPEFNIGHYDSLISHCFLLNYPDQPYLSAEKRPEQLNGPKPHADDKKEMTPVKTMHTQT